MKSKVFYYHYFKRNDCMSIHYNNTCTQVDNVICKNISTSVKKNKEQPRRVIHGHCSNVEFTEIDGEKVAVVT